MLQRGVLSESRFSPVISRIFLYDRRFKPPSLFRKCKAWMMRCRIQLFGETIAASGKKLSTSELYRYRFLPNED
jgi:hypothetical protein